MPSYFKGFVDSPSLFISIKNDFSFKSSPTETIYFAFSSALTSINSSVDLGFIYIKVIIAPIIAITNIICFFLIDIILHCFLHFSP